MAALNIDLIAANVIVKTEKSSFNISFRNFTATSTEGRNGSAESSLLVESREEDKRWGDRYSSFNHRIHHKLFLPV